MRSFKHMVIFCFLTAIFVSPNISMGVQAQASEKISITNSNERIEIFGVSMLPPYEDGWDYEKLTPGKIKFEKAISKEASFVILVSLSRLPAFESKAEFMKFLSDQRQRNTSKSDYEILINDEAFSDEKRCPALRFHTKYKDKLSPYLPTGETAFVVEDYGIFCMHPNGRWRYFSQYSMFSTNSRRKRAG